jgi:preprotein translocase SecF subunit
MLVEYKFVPKLSADQVRSIVAEAGFPDSEVQASGEGETFMIRVPSSGETGGDELAASERILAAATREVPGLQADLLRAEFVGPRVGRELRAKSFWAVTISLILILIYVAIRYELKFGIAAVIALAHDVLVVLAFLSFTNKEITIPVIAALLTIGGYSVNDKIVVFDRVRERKKGSGRQADEALIDLSLNQTLSRTIITGLCVIFTLEALLFFGGSVIHDFAFAILVGVLAGTFSSIFVGSGLVLDMVLGAERRREAQEMPTAKMKA